MFAAEVECAECGHAREYHRLSVWNKCAEVGCGCSRFREPSMTAPTPTTATAAEREGAEPPPAEKHPDWRSLATSYTHLRDANIDLRAALLAARRENEWMRETFQHIADWADECGEITIEDGETHCGACDTYISDDEPHSIYCPANNAGRLAKEAIAALAATPEEK
jgi:hypothetical protein